MRWIESRIRLIEQRVESLYRRLLNDEALIAANRQGLRAAFQQPMGGGSGVYIGCTTSGDLAAGTPGTALTGQTVWVITGGARTNMSTTAKLYNDTPHDIPSGTQVVVAPNPDGSYTVTNTVC